MASKKAQAKDKKDAPPQATTILLVRHGQNEWVNKHKLAGQLPGVHLNKFGRQQAEATGKRLAQSGIKLDAILASPLERTMETAEFIAKPLGLSIEQCPQIGEVDYGDWTGKAIKKLAQLPEWQVIQYYPSKARFPNGESLLGMQNRAVQKIDDLVAQSAGKTLLLVSHADVIKSVVAHYLGTHLDLFQRIIISPASITTIVFTPMRPMVAAVNDTSHLPLPPKKKNSPPHK